MVGGILPPIILRIREEGSRTEVPEVTMRGHDHRFIDHHRPLHIRALGCILCTDPGSAWL